MDEKSFALLERIHDLMGFEKFKILDHDDFGPTLSQGLDDKISALASEGYLVIKYAVGGEYCLGLTSAGSGIVKSVRDERARREAARKAAEEEARRAKEEEERRLAMEQARRTQEEEARRAAEEQARLLAEEIERLKEEEQAHSGFADLTEPPKPPKQPKKKAPPSLPSPIANDYVAPKPIVSPGEESKGLEEPRGKQIDREEPTPQNVQPVQQSKSEDVRPRRHPFGFWLVTYLVATLGALTGSGILVLILWLTHVIG